MTDSSSPEEAPRRFGRVPGGGPVNHREPVQSRPAAQQESIPFPAAVQTPEPAEAPRESENQDGRPRNSQQARQEQPQQNQQRQNNQAAGNQANGGGQPQESRSKRRREKRKRRNQERLAQTGGQAPQNPQNNQNRQRHDNNRGQQGKQQDGEDRRNTAPLDGPKIECDGMLELAPKGFGFLRVPKKNFEQARDDIFVTPETIRKYHLRPGQWIHGLYQEGHRGPQLVEISTINDLAPEDASKLPHFDELKAINPAKRISFETTPERFTTRVVDIMAPVGRGQRGLIVSPPRSGKTTLLLHMAEAIREKYDEAIHLMVVLVDERPEEVTEFRRALPGAEIYASSNDEQARNHCRIAELAIERAKRLVEAGRDVFLIMDSITRLARAYNGGMNNRGRGTGSGGITIGALEVPRRLFAAARNTRGGGSLTILATALIQTNSRADEAIYMEFKGTGNMELVLDRKIAENYIYPAVDIFKSGTRREELLLAEHMLHKIHLIRRGLSGHRPAEAMERLLFFLKKFPNNPQMLLEIKG
ncbi:transcription termination factor Rho [Luteolibacter yonseiensis]|uniref:Transcription termination factor Rho n=2 Tax=Luteolibacter yonseiensis TaxID=1144680 RepID=A0A934R9B3_9BACT|nr:transcription termination factor Rho [Luteolibacter yonseiensis]